MGELEAASCYYPDTGRNYSHSRDMQRSEDITIAQWIVGLLGGLVCVELLSGVLLAC